MNFKRDDSATVDMLHHVGVTNVFEEDVAEWTDAQVQEAENWASAAYLDSFNYNKIDLPKKPSWLSTDE